MVHGPPMSRANAIEFGFKARGHPPTYREKHASEGLIAPFQNLAAGVPGVRSVLAADVSGLGSQGAVPSGTAGGASGLGAAAVPKLCCELEITWHF